MLDARWQFSRFARPTMVLAVVAFAGCSGGNNDNDADLGGLADTGLPDVSEMGAPDVGGADATNADDGTTAAPAPRFAPIAEGGLGVAAYDGQLEVWVSSVPWGEGSPGVPIRVIDSEGRVLDGVTDDDGVFVFDDPLVPPFDVHSFSAVGGFRSWVGIDRALVSFKADNAPRSTVTGRISGWELIGSDGFVRLRNIRTTPMWGDPTPETAYWSLDNPTDTDLAYEVGARARVTMGLVAIGGPGGPSGPEAPTHIGWTSMVEPDFFGQITDVGVALDTPLDQTLEVVPAGLDVTFQAFVRLPDGGFIEFGSPSMPPAMRQYVVPAPALSGKLAGAEYYIWAQDNQGANGLSERIIGPSTSGTIAVPDFAPTPTNISFVDGVASATTDDQATITQFNLSVADTTWYLRTLGGGSKSVTIPELPDTVLAGPAAPDTIRVLTYGAGDAEGELSMFDVITNMTTWTIAARPL